jgi:hypothetical protein
MCFELDDGHIRLLNGAQAIAELAARELGATSTGVVFSITDRMLPTLVNLKDPETDSDGEQELPDYLPNPKADSYLADSSRFAGGQVIVRGNGELIFECWTFANFTHTGYSDITNLEKLPEVQL